MDGRFPKRGTLLIAKNHIYNSKIIRHIDETNANYNRVALNSNIILPGEIVMYLGSEGRDWYMRGVSKITYYNVKIIYNDQIRTLMTTVVTGNDDIIDNDLYTMFEIVKTGADKK